MNPEYGTDRWSQNVGKKLPLFAVLTMQKVKFTLEQAAKAQRGSRGIALVFNLGARWGWVVNDTLRPLYPR
jgi:hypothetical protein